MRPFSCSVCGQMVFFQNSRCLRCRSALGYDPARRLVGALVEPAPASSASSPVAPSGPLRFHDGGGGSFRRCANSALAQCNWLIPVPDPDPWCASCRLTTVRPNDAEHDALAAFAEAEGAKRRLLHQLDGLDLEVVARADDPEHGLAFEFLSSRNKAVTTGHERGVITLDLSESDDAHREFVRQQLGEPYRTVLGHLRHEIAHYFWPSLVGDTPMLDEFRSLFGDERISYADALDAHYSDLDENDTSWVDTHVSRYATMHPWEDWAESFAHYLHIRGGLETAESFGIELGEPTRSAAWAAYRVDRELDIGSLVQSWLAVTLALNGMSRSIGQDDHYPFVLSQRVIEKLDLVHRTVSR